MEQALATLSRTADVLGAAVVGPGESLVTALPPPLEQSLFEAAAQTFETLSATVDTLDLGVPVDSLMVNTDAGVLWFRRVEDWVLVVLTETTANPAIITVSLNTASTQLKRALGRPSLSLNGSLSGALTTSGNFPALSSSSTQAGAVSTRPESLPAAATLTGAYPPGRVLQAPVVPLRGTPIARPSTPSLPMEEGRMPSEPLGLAFVRHLVWVTGQFLGDEAVPLLKGIFAKLSVTPQTVRFEQLGPILSDVEAKLASAEEQRAFRAALQSFRN